MICSHNQDERRQILVTLTDWLMSQIPLDPLANQCFSAFNEICSVNSWASNNDFKNHYMWNTMPNHNSCISFQAIVKNKLSVPKGKVEIQKINTASTISSVSLPRKAIPKKIRGEAWTNLFGPSTKGRCFCCQTELDVFDVWHAGHIISHHNGGKDIASNLRPVCGSCNLSMGTENMDDFKARCYS